MPKFSEASEKQLATCHPDLQRVLREVIKHCDFVVTCGHRNQADQDKAFREGKSKVQWPNGQHNKMPSRAVDVAPYTNGGIDWNDAEAFTRLNGFIQGFAASMGVKIRSGVDWDGDGAVKEHAFLDRPHVELL